jgi:integrase
MTARTVKLPSYRLHKGSGQAFIQISGRRHYLGKYDSDESHERYDRAIVELVTSPTRDVIEPGGVERGSPARRPGDDLLIVQLAAGYLSYAEGYYQKDGKPTGSMDRVRAALGVLRRLYAHLPVGDFGPLKLQAVQRHLVNQGKSRRYTNHLAQAIRRVFRWGVSQEMVPPSVLQALASVPGLKRGRTEAREPCRVKPVAEAVVQATLPHLPPVVCDMARLQRFTGARPAEVCVLRPIDVDRSGPVWVYRPATHKTDYRDGRERFILIGPKAQEILRPYLLRPAESYCFSPRECLEKVNEERRANRRSPMTPSQAKRGRKRRPKTTPKDHYTTCTYRQAITRAVQRANQGKPEDEQIPAWKPNQLRHSAATEIRSRFGVEAAQVILGHAQMSTSEIYAEKDIQRAADIMAKIG